jgi:hypothetical protein
MSLMTFEHLAAQQQALLQALFGQPDETLVQSFWHSDQPQSQRGLQAYRANGHALAERSLHAAYPVIEQMLGHDNFAALARDFWHCHPPSRGDLAHWGNALPAFLASSETLADTPYLADVARVEWALQQAASAADALADPSSFARLGEPDATGLALTLSPGTTLIGSGYPVASLVLSHRHAQPSLKQAAQRLRDAVAETALVWRQGLQPRMAQVTSVEAALLRALLQGQDLPTALDAALAAEIDETQAFDFSLWLTNAVSAGLVTGVHDTNLPNHKDTP